MSDQDIQAAAAGYKAVYDNALSLLQSRVWGGIQHLGLFEDPAEPLLTAQMRANRVMAAAADLRPGQTVIETACGFGGTARYLAGEHGVRVHATNIAETQFVEARDLTQRAGLSHLVDYRYADYHELPFADSSFDVWWCQEALLYSVQKRRVFEEAIQGPAAGRQADHVGSPAGRQRRRGRARELHDDDEGAEHVVDRPMGRALRQSAGQRFSSARIGAPRPCTPSEGFSTIWNRPRRS